MKNSIERGRIKIPQLRFYMREREIYVKVDDELVIDEEIVRLKTVSLLLKKSPMTVKFDETYEFKARLKLRKDEHGKARLELQVSRIRNSLIEALQDHIQSLFRCPSSIQMDIDLEKCFDDLYNFKNLTESYLQGSNVKVSSIDHYFSRYPCHKSANISSPISGEILGNSPLFRIQNLCLGYESGSVFLEKFVGRNLVLNITKMDSSDFHRFLHRWVTSEAYQNLETVFINLIFLSNVEPDEILPHFQVKYFDHSRPSARPRTYFYDPKIINHPTIEVDLCHNSYVEINRKSDGKRAFIRCPHGRQFSFFVLN